MARTSLGVVQFWVIWSEYAQLHEKDQKETKNTIVETTPDAIL